MYFMDAMKILFLVRLVFICSFGVLIKLYE
jgi:hypothetical protein